MTSKATILRTMTGERFGSVVKYGDRWDAISRLVAEHFRVRPDDVGTDEGTGDHDEGLEYLTVDGKRVAFLDEQIGKSPDYSMLPIYSYSEAAE